VCQSSKSVTSTGKGVHLYCGLGKCTQSWLENNPVVGQGKACTCTTWAGKCTLSGSEFQSCCMRRERRAPVLRGRGSVRGVDQSSTINLLPAQGKACTCTMWAGKCTRSGLL
jgi:hypothetical protein